MTIHHRIIGATMGMLVAIGAVVLMAHRTGSERLIVALLLQLVVMQVVMAMIQWPRERKPLTWPQAMLGAVVVSGLALLAFGSVPHEWITYADAELGWGRRDLLVIETPIIDVSRQAIRDIIAAGLYMQNFAAALGFWILWQRRHEMAEERIKAARESGPVPAGTSPYGRPVTKQT